MGDQTLASGLATRAFDDAVYFGWETRAQRIDVVLEAARARGMISDSLLRLVRCPDCRGTLAGDADALTCTTCGRRCARGPGYLDLRPSATFTEQTKYLDEALHADARHETVSPRCFRPAMRQWMLRRLLKPAPGDTIVDLGCGSGRSLVWNHASGATIVGIDVAPYFAQEALERGELVLGDLRRLPFADGAFGKGYALDVLRAPVARRAGRGAGARSRA